jgi:heat shock protein HslJ
MKRLERASFVTCAAAAALLAACRTSPPTAAVPELPAYRALGQEPAWLLRVAGRGLVLDRLGHPSQSAAITAQRPLFDGRRIDAAAPGGRWWVEILPGLCRDTMSGMPFPDRVVLHGATTAPLRGCGGEPASLIAGDWRVVEIAGAAPAAGSVPTIAFDTAAARIAGSTGCNRYSGGYVLSGESLRLTAPVATRMPCAPPLDRQEQAMLALLAGVTHHDLTPDGALVLVGAQGNRLVARRR